MSLTKDDLKSISSLMDDKFGLFEKKINKNIDEKIDSLARITADGFTEVGGRFNQVDKQLKEIDKRFEQVDKKIDTKINSLHAEMNFEFTKVHEEIEEVNEKVSRIDKRTLDDENAMAGDIINLDKRVSKLEKLKIA